ncbi:AlpA family phage regulatory protein [Pseudoalteromonas sp. Cn5-37]|uniref:helix-turn-helix transcriptional regulator n=1 Tax=Pseudoalteromonas sp. Cn5-37 TaxID=2908886 RepID=UPI001F440064|nr:AlpA family phage regulatory protein [Pseudoalteromonas sp. Cn5-37]MCF2917460.1 AlpA family phage regulatory protein [Pseudoalteromonas sp. Cn5-37]
MPIKNEIIRPKQLTEQLNISKSTLWRWREDPDFPRAISLGARSIGFLVKEIDEWLIARQKLTEKGEV